MHGRSSPSAAIADGAGLSPPSNEGGLEAAHGLDPRGLAICLMPPRLPLALVGGPMSEGDYEILTAVEDAGGRFVLDATESGERTLPAPVDRERLRADPWEELVRIYFDCIPAVFQRPNDRLFAWLRRPGCRAWCAGDPRPAIRLVRPLARRNAAAPRGTGSAHPGMGCRRQRSRARAGAVGRMEAFLEMLR